MAKRCEICGNKISDYKLFLPKGCKCDMISVCNLCYNNGRSAEAGVVEAVDYFTKQIDLGKASANGILCVDQCLSNAKVEIQKKLTQENTIANDKPAESRTNPEPIITKADEDLAMNRMIVTPLDTLVGFNDIEYCPLTVVSFGITRDSNKLPATEIVNETEKMKLRAYRKYKADAIIGLRINEAIDALGNILITMYATPVRINDIHYE